MSPHLGMAFAHARLPAGVGLSDNNSEVRFVRKELARAAANIISPPRLAGTLMVAAALPWPEAVTMLLRHRATLQHSSWGLTGTLQYVVTAKKLGIRARTTERPASHCWLLSQVVDALLAAGAAVTPVALHEASTNAAVHISAFRKIAIACPDVNAPCDGDHILRHVLVDPVHTRRA